MKLRLGTRGSLLARTQSGLVAQLLQRRHPGLEIETTIFKTSGDQIAERPLHEFGGKGLFTKELEQALLDGAIDFAVHSFKDVPVTMPLVEQGGLVVAAVPTREDARDVLVSLKAKSLDELPSGAKLGTGSLRRRCQVLSRRPDLVVEGIRGNIDTRLRKLRAGEFDAVVLAMAGVKRADLFEPSIMSPVPTDVLLPASGQGALALQCRRDDGETRSLLGVLNDPVTATCVQAERELVRLLEGDCHSPIAAFAEIRGTTLQLGAVVGTSGGEPPVVNAAAVGQPTHPAAVARNVHEQLERFGAADLLRRR